MKFCNILFAILENDIEESAVEYIENFKWSWTSVMPATNVVNLKSSEPKKIGSVFNVF